MDKQKLISDAENIIRENLNIPIVSVSVDCQEGAEYGGFIQEQLVRYTELRIKLKLELRAKKDTTYGMIIKLYHRKFDTYEYEELVAYLRGAILQHLINVIWPVDHEVVNEKQ